MQISQKMEHWRLSYKQQNMKTNQATQLTRATLTWPGITERGFDFSRSIWNSFALVCFFKKLKMHSLV